MFSAWIGILSASAFLLSIAALFHHYAVRFYAAERWLSRGATLLDVDTGAEFARHHPANSFPIPLEELSRRSHELGETARPVVVFAHSWLRAARAVHELRSLGFEEVMNAAGAHERAWLHGSSAGPTDEHVRHR